MKGLRLATAVSGALAALLLTGGCATNANLDIGTAMSATEHLKYIKPTSGGHVYQLATEPSAATYVATGAGLIRDAKAERYLQSIVKKLLDHWTGPKPERVGIFITTGEGMHGTATPSGDILIPISAFEAMETEDQLAALIGHELGHVILKHLESEKHAHQLATVASVAFAVAFGVSNVKNGGMRRNGNEREFYVKNPAAVRSDTYRALAVHQSFITVTQDVLLSAFSRNHEYESDVFGMRLTGNAGWNHEAIFALAEGWKNADKTKADLQQKLMQQGGLVQGPMMALGQLAGEVIARHPSAEARLTHLRADAKNAFANIEPRPENEAGYKVAMNSGDFASKRKVWRLLRQATVALRDGKLQEAKALVDKTARLTGARHPDSRLFAYDAWRSAGMPEDKAFALMASADLREPASRQFYDRLAMGYAWKRDNRQAVAVVNIAERLYGRNVIPLRMHVRRVEFQQAQMKPDNPAAQIYHRDMAAMMRTCEATQEKELVGECRFALTGIAPDSEYRNCGGVLSALATLNPTSATQCGPDRTKSLVPSQATTAPPGGNVVANRSQPVQPTSMPSLGTLVGGALGGFGR